MKKKPTKEKKRVGWPFLVTYFLLKSAIVGFVIGCFDIYGIGAASERNRRHWGQSNGVVEDRH